MTQEAAGSPHRRPGSPSPRWPVPGLPPRAMWGSRAAKAEKSRSCGWMAPPERHRGSAHTGPSQPTLPRAPSQGPCWQPLPGRGAALLARLSQSGHGKRKQQQCGASPGSDGIQRPAWLCHPSTAVTSGSHHGGMTSGARGLLSTRPTALCAVRSLPDAMHSCDHQTSPVTARSQGHWAAPVRGRPKGRDRGRGSVCGLPAGLSESSPHLAQVSTGEPAIRTTAGGAGAA